MGWYCKDFELGRTMLTQGRTITEADIGAFAGLTGDETVLGMLGVQWSFKAPVRAGDTLSFGFTALEVRTTKMPDRGIETLHPRRNKSAWTRRADGTVPDRVHAQAVAKYRSRCPGQRLFEPMTCVGFYPPSGDSSELQRRAP